MADVETLANDIETQSARIIDVGREGEIEWMVTQRRIFRDNEKRVSMMGDSLTWQANQLGVFQGLAMEEKQFKWNLNAGAEHCETCLEYASIGDFTLETLPGIPGSAPTVCDGGCKCYLT